MKDMNMAKKSAVVSEIIDDIRRVFQVVNEQSKKAKRETGLTGPQLWAIKTIAELSSVRVSDLARRMYLHPATVVGILNRLELQGLIKNRGEEFETEMLKNKNPIVDRVLIGKDTGWIWSAY